MRTILLLAALLPCYVLGACAAGGKSSGSDDDDDDDSSGGSTSVGGAGGTSTGTTTTTSTLSTTNTTTTSSTTTTTSTSASSCYAGQGDCDPLQSGSCPTAGAACDIDSGTGLFVCFPPPNTAGSGAACDPSAGPYCMNGLTCVNNGSADVCAAYCCSTDDCASCTPLGMVGNVDVQVCAQ